MKKLYFLFLLCFVAYVGFGQIKSSQDWQKLSDYAINSTPLKSTSLPGEIVRKQITAPSNCQIDILLLTNDNISYLADVHDYLLATGKFSSIDMVNGTVPTVQFLNNYDAILVWADNNLSDNIGDSLALYIDGGGGVVSSCGNLNSPWGIEGTRFNIDYQLMDMGSLSIGGAVLGTIYDSYHPIMENVMALNNPNPYRSSVTTMSSGSVVVAEWSDGIPLVVVKENLGPANARRADVNIFPPSSTIRGDFWDASTDGDILLANALVWVSGKCEKECIEDITQENDAVECGAVINYEEPESWSSAIVTQIDKSGLTSGDLFPVGVTEQSYEIDYGTSIDTCNFNVTVVDTTPPEVWCRNIGVALDEEGETRIYPIFLKDSVSDNCGIESYNIDVNRFDCGDVGKNIVTLTVKDKAGNMASCTSEVTINDGFAPSVICRDYEVVLDEEGLAEISADSIDGGSTDACGIAGMELSQSVFTGADLGENLVTLYVTDVNGNTDSCNSVVTVSDAIAPVASCNSIDVTIADANGYELTDDDIALLAAGSSDNATSFESLIVEVSPSVFACDQIGDSVAVQVTVIDEAGNESTCESKIYIGFVLDTELADIVVSLDAGKCETTIDYPSIFSEESCASMNLIDGLGADGVFPAGTTVESWEVVVGGEADTVSFNVIVNSENLAPTLDATSDTTMLEDEMLIVELTSIGDGGDCVVQELLVSAEGLNTELIETIEVNYEAGSSSAELTIAFVANQSGEAEVVVSVEDEAGATVKDTFVVTVEPVNDAPELVAAIADNEVQAEDALIMTLSKILGDVFTDADGDDLTWSIMVEGDTIPAWLTFEESSIEHELNINPSAADTGCYNIVVQVSDPSGATATDTFEVCVKAVPVGVTSFGQAAFDVTMYPNPSRGLVNIELESSSIEGTEISVSNVTGAEVFRRSYLAGEQIQIDLSENVSGMYLLRVAQDGKQVIKKLILDKN